MSRWRSALKRVPGMRGLGRWLRRRFHPHYAALRRIDPAQLLQPEAQTCAARYPAIFAFLARDLAGLARPRVLSWGCSTGEELLSLRAALPGAEIVGVEINPRSLRKAARRVAHDAGITLRLAGDPAALVGEMFDAVLCLAVLRHARLQDEAPARCSAVLPFARAERFVTALAALVRPQGLLALWNVHFRLADMAVADAFAVVLDLPRGVHANQPLYGPGDARLDGATCTAAVYRRQA